MNEEIDLIDLFKILWKRKLFIILPTVVIGIFSFVFFSSFPVSYIAKCKINTDDLKAIKIFGDDENKYFSVIDYNNYIKPINDYVKKNNKCYEIGMGTYDNNQRLPVNGRLVYSLIIKQKDKEIRKELFERNVKDFFSRYSKLIIYKQLTAKKKLKITLENQIYNIDKNNNIVEKKIKSLEKYIDKKSKNFIGFADKDALSYLPPYQQFMGLKIQKEQNVISIEEIKKDLKELQFFINLAENKFVDIETLYKNKDLKKNKKTYFEIELMYSRLEYLLKDAINNIKIIKQKKPIKKYVFIILVLSFFIFVFIAFVVEYSNKK